MHPNPLTVLAAALLAVSFDAALVAQIQPMWRDVAVPTPPSIAFVALGWSTTTTGAFPLPLPLDTFGMPGCFLLQSSEAAAEPTTITGPGTATFSLPLPNIPSLAGLELHLQGWAVAPGYNLGNTIVSNGVSWLIGNI